MFFVPKASVSFWRKWVIYWAGASRSETLSACGRSKPNVYIHVAEISEADQTNRKLYRETAPASQRFNVYLFTFLLFTERNIATYTWLSCEAAMRVSFYLVRGIGLGTRHAARLRRNELRRRRSYSLQLTVTSRFDPATDRLVHDRFITSKGLN